MRPLSAAHPANRSSHKHLQSCLRHRGSKVEVQDLRRPGLLSPNNELKAGTAASIEDRQVRLLVHECRLSHLQERPRKCNSHLDKGSPPHDHSRVSSKCGLRVESHHSRACDLAHRLRRVSPVHLRLERSNEYLVVVNPVWSSLSVKREPRVPLLLHYLPDRTRSLR